MIKLKNWALTALSCCALLASLQSNALAQDTSAASKTTINAIQGSSNVSPKKGETLSVRGIITADMQKEYGGIYILAGAGDRDENASTSEGLFLKLAKGQFPDMAIGDVVSATGKVMEIEDQTILEVSNLEKVSSTDLEPVSITLPLADDQSWEAYENMYVTFPQKMVVTESYNLGRYGQLLISLEERLIQPTQIMRPGPEAVALSKQYEKRSITLDDGTAKQNPNPVPFITGNTVRLGDSIDNLTGIIVQDGNGYSVIATKEVSIARTNPRPVSPPPVGGDVKVASYNLLNFFNGNGAGADFPTARGADTMEEFKRQRAKTLEAIHNLDADVIGFMELENDGFGDFSAIAEIVRDLNQKAGVPQKAYAFVEPNTSVGSDAICNGIIYRPLVVSLVGQSTTINEDLFQSRRPPVIASFKHLESGEQFTICVNHFKSKGCRNSSGQNADQNDGQGCYSYERTLASQYLLKSLPANPTGVEDTDILVLGDLNAYSMEDPVQEFITNGWIDVVDMKVGKEKSASYVYRGLAGSLDHMLATPSLAGKVSGAGVWNINSPEPAYIDYNTEYKEQDLTDKSQYRSSDHDPVIVGFSF